MLFRAWQCAGYAITRVQWRTESDCPSADVFSSPQHIFQMTDLQLIEQEKPMRSHVKIPPDCSYNEVEGEPVVK